MNDPRRPLRYGPPQPGPGPGWPQGPVNTPPADPAYADQAPYAPTYGGHVPQWAPGSYDEANPTQQLPPQYWQQNPGQPGEVLRDGPPPPEGPKTPRWLWIAAGAAVVLVIGLVIALVIANISIKNQTALEPLPPIAGPSSTIAPPTTRTSPTPSSSPAPTTTSGSATPTTTPTAGAMQTVVYTVTGEGRAISVTYMDTGDVIQTEFNVALPWSKEVSLSRSANHPASVTIVNIGHNVTCSVTVSGVQVRQRTGVGLTICDASG
ncbi:MmpS family transport accessory protein [Mycobacterium marinum]|uniref:MmpS family transport accessory protein n=1 Tax=Mycobacterium marinum TaxID=1781 RepID=UPI000B961564|nr:MmpS family transport accessory protein [Mycobacterium marinum]